ncbi:hypothetical protein [Chryseobacterium takakiae]|uniref:Uncharacterized protein n=1 Tax=Chryseobacterium takakiae TaxID=1302685 RepID=A0A1M4WYI2_9FLAO|nr:hypothetical protein [Chryseobacterium takakiae]SHE86255.1 hypothetical protein SAMN05444408_10589 [Chryseobacterium takakiae]
MMSVKLEKPLVYGSILGFSGQVALGALPGIVGSMMAILTLKIIADLSLQLNRLSLIDTLKLAFSNS